LQTNFYVKLLVSGYFCYDHALHSRPVDFETLTFIYAGFLLQ